MRPLHARVSPKGELVLRRLECELSSESLRRYSR